MSKTKFIKPKTHQEWLEMRSGCITSTDSAGLFGLSPYATMWELYQQKLNNEIGDFKDNERMKWGRRLEQSIAEGVAEDLGLRVRALKEFAFHPDFRRMGASFDYEIVGVNDDADDELKELFDTNGPGLMEIKNVDSLIYRKTWIVEEDGDWIEAPPRIELQCQHQMEVSGHEWSVLVPFVGGNDPKIIVRPRDHDVGSAILNKVRDFWDMVDSSNEPDPDFNLDSDHVISRNQTSTDDVFETDDIDIIKLMKSYKAVSAIGTQAGKDKKEIKAQLLIKIGDAGRVITSVGTISAKTVKDTEIKSYTRKGYRGFSVNLKRK